MNWRVGLIVVTVLIAVFGIPSLPRTHSHLIYWAFAFVFELVLLIWLKPYAKRTDHV
jgi:hypothetical protein